MNVTKVEKISLDDLRLNPKGYKNGKSAAKPRIEESPETIENIV